MRAVAAVRHDIRLSSNACVGERFSSATHPLTGCHCVCAAVVPLFDPPRHDTKDTIERCLEMGIHVKMITGDQLLIGQETAKQLGMGTNMFTTDVLIKVGRLFFLLVGGSLALGFQLHIVLWCSEILENETSKNMSGDHHSATGRQAVTVPEEYGQPDPEPRLCHEYQPVYI